jgi:hypothetical protein
VPNYIEDVFQTWLYTGNGTTQTITNGVDLAGKGGLVWIKNRGSADWHQLQDTLRGAGRSLNSNSTASQGGVLDDIGSFNSNGFSLVSVSANFNASGQTYVSWTFREQPKFFDVVTWTGNGVNGRNISHSLGSVPGCIIVKRTDTTSDWTVYHRSLGTVGDPQSYTLALNTTAAQVASSAWNDSAPTSTTFQVSSGAALNASGGTYVAYIFAHNAGGFGLTGTDNVISCGSFTSNSTGFATVDLGYEPQWVLWKISGEAGYGWVLADNMRGLPVPISGAGDARSLFANTSAAETDNGRVIPNATGFTINSFGANAQHIYIAIRRGPMKVPTTGTSVFAPVLTTNDAQPVVAGFPVDFFLEAQRSAPFTAAYDRLRGSGQRLYTYATGVEASTGVTGTFASNTSVTPNEFGASSSIIVECFRRAPGFFDEVCYTGTGGVGNLPITHGLGAIPELVIIKNRANTGQPWSVHSNSFPASRYLQLNLANAFINDTIFGTADDTTTTFNTTGTTQVNAAANTYVAYLFATCPGVSKVGSFTGTGATQVINCGFTGGARFILIKATSTTGNWLVWDSARGIVAGNDPYLALNSTAAEVTNTDWVDTAATGFELSNAGGNLANSSGVSYIFLAIA